MNAYYRVAYSYNFGVRFMIFKAIIHPYNCCQIPYDVANFPIADFFLVPFCLLYIWLCNYCTSIHFKFRNIERKLCPYVVVNKIMLRRKTTWCKYNENRYICQKDRNPSGMKMSTQDYPLVFSEWWGNPHTTGQAAVSPKTS